MADNPASKKKAPTPTKKATPRKRAIAQPDAGDRPDTTPPHGDDMREQIARRAYELSQGRDAGSEEENWLRAEREVSDRR
jgi:hypothetical protein